ncbi:MAG: helix-turn-helix domain-containing protein, partial [Phaeodactylibacter sp.]|nr:helix-turn-helix domain-containing protein [Phaeodactylibacter sp.]
YFTDFRIFNNPVAVGEGEMPLRLPIYKARHIEVQSAQKVISFQFTALNFINPERQAYRFWLAPFHDGWQYNGNKREVTFTNLDPGVYHLRVETAENGYDWAGTSLALHVLPPWHRTWWAYTLWTMLLAGAVYWLYQFQLNRKLAEAEALRLKELDQAKARLYANITHEFRTPLTIILGMVREVKEDPAHWFNEGLKLIHRNGTRLLHLVNQMLDLSKLESGHIPLQPGQADIVNYLKYLTESFHSFADTRDIRLHFLTELHSFTMDFDAEKLRKVVSNLLSNAIKFTPEGGDIYLQLAVEQPEGHSAHLILIVKDNGAGIPAEYLPHIFDRFYSLPTAPLNSPPSGGLGGAGAGIGLALTKELVTVMKGTIAVESKVGAGTKFTVHLPVTRQAPKASPSPEQGPPIEETAIYFANRAGFQSNQLESTSGQEEKDNPLLLIIEDNADVVTYLASFLSGNYRLALAPDGQEGINKAIELVPDLIVSDVMMPRKDGFEVCASVKSDERTCHIPVILLTSKAGEKPMIEGLEHGADAYIAKPFNREELMVRIEKLIDGRRRIQEQYAKKDYLRKNAGVSPASLDDVFLEKIAGIIEENLSDENFGLPELCRQAAMSRSQLFRKLKALTGRSTTQFIRSVRLEKARGLLETTTFSISEVSYKTGFTNPNYFSRMFRKEFGMAPSEVRKE